MPAMVTNDRIDELQHWIMESRLQANENEWVWYQEMNDALEELKTRRLNASYRGAKS